VSEIEKLLTLQEIDSRIREIERELKDIPERQERERLRLEEHQAEVVQAEEALHAKQAQLKELELEVDAEQEKITKLRQQQVEIKTNKEFKALESEISGHQAQIKGIEDGELGMMEEVDALQRALQEKRQALKEEEAAVEGDVAAWSTRSSELQSQVEAKRAERGSAVEGIDREWLACYERIFSRKDKALVPLEDGFCGGCHMQQPPYVVHDTKKRTKIVLCGTCGRMLC